jgi:hypothetical protein
MPSDLAVVNDTIFGNPGATAMAIHDGVIAGIGGPGIAAHSPHTPSIAEGGSRRAWTPTSSSSIATFSRPAHLRSSAPASR